jgi:hypothetical protein
VREETPAVYAVPFGIIIPHGDSNVKFFCWELFRLTTVAAEVPVSRRPCANQVLKRAGSESLLPCTRFAVEWPHPSDLPRRTPCNRQTRTEYTSCRFARVIDAGTTRCRQMTLLMGGSNEGTATHKRVRAL